MSKTRLIRLTEMLERTGFSRSTWYRVSSRDPFAPKSIKLSTRCIAFVEDEVDAYIDRLINRSDAH